MKQSFGGNRLFTYLTGCDRLIMMIPIEIGNMRHLSCATAKSPTMSSAVYPFVCSRGFPAVTRSDFSLPKVRHLH